jgi:hypothetical protein
MSSRDGNEVLLVSAILKGQTGNGNEEKTTGAIRCYVLCRSHLRYPIKV